MSGFRTGQDSSFPDSPDEFVIKHPFQTGANHLEAAAHFNHYFDATYNLESALMFLLGGPMVTHAPVLYSGVPASGSDLRLALSSITAVASGTSFTTETAFTVPDFMGEDPFNDSRFSIAFNTYLQPLGSGLIRGIAEGNPNASTYLNDMIEWPQVYTLIQPTGGRGAKVIHKVVYSQHGGLTGNTFADDFNRTASSPSWGPNWVESENNNQRALEIQVTPVSVAVLQARIANSEGGKSGIAYPPAFGTAADQEVEFELYSSFGTTMCRGGPMVRFSGTRTNATFYGLALSNRTSPYNTAQLVKIQGANLDTPDEPEGSNTWVVTSGTITEIGSSFSTKNTSTYGSTIKYRLRAVGTVVSVDEQINNGSWTTVASAVDASLSSGRPGFFVKSRRVSKSAYGKHLIRNCVCRVVTFNSDSPGTDFLLITNLLFGLVGKSAHVHTTGF